MTMTMIDAVTIDMTRTKNRKIDIIIAIVQIIVRHSHSLIFGIFYDLDND